MLWLEGMILLGWFITLVQVLLSSVSGDVFIMQQAKVRRQRSGRAHLPVVSVIIPAYNEELTIARALSSIWSNDYPAGKLEVIVVNDGSTDRTKETVQLFQQAHKDGCQIRLLNRPNKGKARAINYALKYCATGRLVMCLDADSTLAKNAIRNAAQYFKDRSLIALCGHVDVIEDGSIIALMQRLEYLAAFRLKSGQTQLGVNYIIPGTGSMFRRSLLQRVAYYEGNTLAEDFDLTIKIIDRKRRKEHIGYAPVHNWRDLLRQRFRWTYGIIQVFFKRSHLFFSRRPEHHKRLTWGMLPLVLLQDIAFLFSPLSLVYLVLNVWRLNGPETIGLGIIGFSLFLSISVWSTAHLSFKDKLRLSYYVPPAYLLIYMITLANYLALVKTVWLAPKLRTSLVRHHFTWRSPARKRAVNVASA
jgi:biofilm PGA synthesis N-glycosyltransferase PgaC